MRFVSFTVYDGEKTMKANVENIVRHADVSEKAIERYLCDQVKNLGGVCLKYSSANTLERLVATAAPSTSRPAGKSTNINRGSSAMFSKPPKAMPALAWRERPSDRIR